MSYGDYVEQLTYLLFLKMADERTRPPYKQQSPIPLKYGWQKLMAKDGETLFEHYQQTLKALSRESGTLGIIFGKAENKFKNPAKLRRVAADLIDKENWSAMSADVKGDAYEGLLEKNAQETKSGAGQYFTPRPLISRIVEVIAPRPGERICDPACGTGGFLLAAQDFILRNSPHLTNTQKRRLKNDAFRGWELVDNTARLCAMNLLLHGIGGDTPPVAVADSLRNDSGKHFEVVMTNPPFGKSSSTTVISATGKTTKQKDTVLRDDFWVTTSNKQLNFVQHVKSILTINGRAAIVVPDNVLFEGGGGETVRRNLLKEYDVHTLLRLPIGIFYAQGVKANVLFFDRKPAGQKAWTTKLWVYDLRINARFTLKTNPLAAADLDDFVRCYNPKNRHKRAATWDNKKNPQGRWRVYNYAELIARDKTNLDISWLRDDSLATLTDLPKPEQLIDDMMNDLTAALSELKAIKKEIKA